MQISTSKRIAGMQTYYFSRKLAQIRQMQDDGHEIVHLGIGNPSEPPAKEVVEAMNHHAARSDTHGYQNYKGLPELREAFTAWMKHRFGVTQKETQVLTSMGSKEAIMHISMAFLDEGDAVLVPDPGYPSYKAATQMVQAKPVAYNLLPENGWLPDFNELENLVRNHPVKLMWLNYPHMPTGATATPELMQQLSDFARAHQILLVHDNPYAFVRNKNPLSIMAAPGALDLALELHSLSKSHNMAGWRIGFITGSEEHLEAIMKVKSNMNTGSFFPQQMAAVRALQLPESWYRELNANYRSKAATAYQIMDTLGCSYEENTSGMFIWARIPSHFKSAAELSDYLLYNAGVFMAPGFIFGKNGEQYIRLSIASPQEALSRALEKIQHLFKKAV